MGKIRNNWEQLGTIRNDSERFGKIRKDTERLGKIGKVSKTRNSFASKHLRIFAPKNIPFFNSPSYLSYLNYPDCGLERFGTGSVLRSGKPRGLPFGAVRTHNGRHWNTRSIGQLVNWSIGQLVDWLIGSEFRVPSSEFCFSRPCPLSFRFFRFSRSSGLPVIR